MKFRLFFSVSVSFLCLSLLASPQAAGETENVRPLFADMPDYQVPEFQMTAPTAAQQAVFATLKKQYPALRLDEAFRTLKKLSEDRDYLSYLADTYTQGKRLKNFKHFTENVHYSKARYYPYFQATFHVKTPQQMTSVDLIGAHVLANSLWKSEVREFHGEKAQDPTVFLHPSVKRWLKSRGIRLLNVENPAGFQEILTKLLSLALLVSQNQKGDAALVKTFFQQYPEDTRLLRLAIQEPILFARILDSFTDPDTFLKWVAGHFYEKQKKEKQ